MTLSSEESLTFTRDDGAIVAYDNAYRRSGTITHRNGDTYIGVISEHKACGSGMLRRQDGSFYEGTFHDDLPHGSGTEQIPGGMHDGVGVLPAVYTGNFKRGCKHGTGVLVYNDGNRYEGDFVEDIVSGFGVFTWRDGKRYEGEWRDGKFDGYGRLTFGDSQKYYEGHYKQDAKHGLGYFRWADGRAHLGMWKDNRQSGPGIFMTATGQARKGEWPDSSPHQVGKAVSPAWQSPVVDFSDVHTLMGSEFLLQPPPQLTLTANAFYYSRLPVSGPPAPPKK